jgi:hypothetical protein
MRRLIAFIILVLIKVISRLFFRAHYHWFNPIPNNQWNKIKVMVFLNHTSLYEPLFIQIIPFSYLWHLSGHFNIPGADITLKRPIVGTFWKLMIPNISSITRKKDASWENYLNSIRSEDVIMIAPEGRMKRTGGLDKYGKPMTVRGGVADIIQAIEKGGMLLCFSGGLHHVQRPGQTFPKLFQNIYMNLSYHDISEYKTQFKGSPRENKMAIVQDLQKRLENNCPKMNK